MSVGAEAYNFRKAPSQYAAAFLDKEHASITRAVRPLTTLYPQQPAPFPTVAIGRADSPNETLTLIAVNGSFDYATTAAIGNYDGSDDLEIISGAGAISNNVTTAWLLWTNSGVLIEKHDVATGNKQVAGAAGVQTAVPAAVLQLDSVTQGFLPPRLTTTERNNIASPVAGLVIYNTTTGVLNFYNGAVWGAV